MIRAHFLLLALLVGLMGLPALLPAADGETAADPPVERREVPSEETGPPAPLPETQAQETVFLLFILVLAGFLGFELISRVPSTLHTPLMSGANAISGITIVGAILALHQDNSTFGIVLGTLAVTFASINVAGGYMVTDRMLAMFKKKGGGASS